MVKDVETLGGVEMGKKMSVNPDTIRRVGSVAGKTDVDRVGIVEQNYGFGMGKAPKESKPTAKGGESSLVNVEKGDGEFVQPTPQKADNMDPLGEDMDEYDEDPKDKNELYKVFKEDQGKEYVEGIQKNIADQKLQKNTYHELNDTMEGLKNEIGKLKDKFDKKQLVKNQENLENEPIDEEEFTVIRQLKECKKNHRNLLEKMRIVKSTIHQLELNIKNNKILLVKKFDEFLQKKYNMKLEDPKVHHMSDKESISKSSDQMDPEAVAFVRAKQKFNLIQQARKQERMRGNSRERGSPMATHKG